MPPPSSILSLPSPPYALSTAYLGIEYVVTIAAAQIIVAVAAIDPVISISAIQPVVAGLAFQSVVAALAIDGVVARTAANGLLGNLSRRRIDPVDEAVIAGASVDDVVAVAGVDIFLAGAAKD